jgi:hypothetical protein
VSLDVLMATSLKMSVFWDVAQCSLVDTDQLTFMRKAIRSSEMLVSIYQATCCNIPEDSDPEQNSCIKCLPLQLNDVSVSQFISAEASGFRMGAKTY